MLKLCTSPRSPQPLSLLLRIGVAGTGALIATLSAQAAPRVATATPLPAGCSSNTFEGDVTAGHSFTHAIDAHHVFVLEALRSGWIVRVRLTGATSGAPMHDLAELATPPYRSPSPLLISTDWAFRAQDAVAWNPRSFHFFSTSAQQRTAQAAFLATERDPTHPAAGAALFTLIPQACPAQLTILDARIVGGTANQSGIAATVASHFQETAHSIDTSEPATTLGRITALRFRVVIGNAEKAAPPNRR